MFLFVGSNDFKKSAIILKLVSEWNKKSNYKMSRITIQKMCYFAEAVSVPLGYRFSVFKYGPYSQDLFDQIDDMIMYGLLSEENKDNGNKDNVSLFSTTDLANDLLASYDDFLCLYDDKINFLTNYFKDMSLRDLELFSTIHYYHTATNGYYNGLDKDELRELTINYVINAVKDKFIKKEISNAYFKMEELPFAFC